MQILMRTATRTVNLKLTALAILSSAALSACSLVQLQPGRMNGYVNNNEISIDVQGEREHEEYKAAANELGLYGRELSEEQELALQNRLLLKKQEAGLQTRSERLQYHKYKQYLKSDRQRLNFLRLNTLEERENWAKLNGFDATNENFTDFESRAIDASDIFLGMSKKAVKESWGDPKNIEVAGDALYGNEKWQYANYISSPDGYILEYKIVYFEGGRVAGWEKN